MSPRQEPVSVFAARLDMARCRKGLTQDGLAEVAGVGVATIRRWLAGASPQNRLLQRVADALDVQLDWLLGVGAECPRGPGNVAESAGERVVELTAALRLLLATEDAERAGHRCPDREFALTYARAILERGNGR